MRTAERARATLASASTVQAQALEVLHGELERDVAPAPRPARAREVEEAAHVTAVGGEGVPREAGLDPQGLEVVLEPARELVGAVACGLRATLVVSRARFSERATHAGATLARGRPRRQGTTA